MLVESFSILALAQAHANRPNLLDCRRVTTVDFVFIECKSVVRFFFAGTITIIVLIVIIIVTIVIMVLFFLIFIPVKIMRAEIFKIIVFVVVVELN